VAASPNVEVYWNILIGNTDAIVRTEAWCSNSDARSTEITSFFSRRGDKLSEDQA
jgi:hypothetical protein